MDENIKGTVLCQMTEQCWFWFVTSFTDLGSAFDGTCTCMYAHEFQNTFVLVQNSLVLNSGYW